MESLTGMSVSGVIDVDSDVDVEVDGGVEGDASIGNSMPASDSLPFSTSTVCKETQKPPRYLYYIFRYGCSEVG